MTKARDLANIISGGFTESDIPALATAKITSGTFTDARIPNLNTSKLTAGTLADARIPNLNASKLTAGTLADARIPNLNASKINAGTIATARLGSGTASSSTFLRGDGTYASAGGTNTPLFRAYANANWNSANGADTTVPYNAESFDPQGTFNTTTKKFTPAVSGKYFFYAIIKLSSSQDTGLMEFYLLKNNSVVSALTARGSGNGSMSLQLSAVHVSDTNDFFDVAFYQNSGGTITAFGGANISYFTAFKLTE